MTPPARMSRWPMMALRQAPWKHALVRWEHASLAV
jgi:hypothetical protein